MAIKKNGSMYSCFNTYQKYSTITKNNYAENYIVSKIFSRYFYRNIGQIKDPLRKTGEQTILLEEALTQQKFFLRRISSKHIIVERYRDLIMSPPKLSRLVLWPCDLVYLRDEELSFCTSYLNGKYDSSSEFGGYALLFPYYDIDIRFAIDYANFVDLKSWKNPNVKRFVSELLSELSEFNMSGWFLGDINLNSVFFDNKGKIRLDFSNFIFSAKEQYSPDLKLLLEFELDGYESFFMEPAAIKNKVMDLNSQNYSLASLIFYLFIGVYAYRGRMFWDYSDQQYCSAYFENPYFIFDLNDQKNDLGISLSVESYKNLWIELPERIKNMFIRVLNYDNALRLKSIDNPTTYDWIDILKDL